MNEAIKRRVEKAEAAFVAANNDPVQVRLITHGELATEAQRGQFDADLAATEAAGKSAVIRTIVLCPL